MRPSTTNAADRRAARARRRGGRRLGGATRSRPSSQRAPERAGGVHHARRLPGQARLHGRSTSPTRRSEDIGLPGPLSRSRAGPYPTMYRGRLWTMRQIAGFGTAEDTNQRFKYLIAQGQTGLSTDFDMPTLMGYDSDHPMSEGEVGREGVAIDTLADMERAVRRHRPREDLGVDDDQPVARGSCSRCTSRSREERGLRPRQAVRHDPGRHPQGVQSRRRNGSSRSRRRCGSCATASPTAREHMKRYNPINISGYHISRGGRLAARRRSAFTMCNPIAYVEEVTEDRHARRRVRAAARVLLRLPGGLLRGDREVPRGAPRATRRS